MVKSFERTLVSFTILEALINLHLGPHPIQLESPIDVCVHLY